MAVTSYPFDNQDTTETQFSQFFRELQDSGIAGEVGGAGFVCSTDGSGLDVQVSAGFGVLRGHAVNSDGPATVTMATAHASLPRIDRIILRLDPVANSITLQVLTGVPAATPAATACAFTETGIFELSVAEVRVAAGALNIASADLSDNRTYLGQRVGNWTTGTRPTSPRKGRFGFNSSTLTWEFYTGTAWTNLIPPLSKTVRVPHTFTISNDVLVASGDVSYIPPFYVPVPAGQSVSIGTTNRGRCRINSGTSAAFDLRVNGVAIGGSASSATTTDSDIPGGASVTNLANNDKVSIVVTAVSGTPRNMTVTVYLDYTF